jgi:hypothetical protein
MALVPSQPVEVVQSKLVDKGFQPATISALQPSERELCSRLHCQKCRAADLECRAFSRWTEGAQQESRAVAVCPRCEAAEVLPRSGPELLLRQADEHAGWAAAGAVVAMGVALGLASVVHGQTLKIALTMLILLPIAFLAYLGRNGPGGGADAGGP